MQRDIYIVGANKGFSEYVEKLVQLAGERDVDAMSCTLEEYQNMNSLSFITCDETKFIFVGTDLLGQAVEPSISSWEYERFGCRIGWKENRCAIFARDTDLPYADYKEFRDYCKGVQLEHSDVIVPPESPIIEGIEAIKDFFDDKKNKSAHKAQYSTLVHEFMDNYFDRFIDFGSSTSDSGKPEDLENILTGTKETASDNMSWKQNALCHAIIHTAALACSAVAFLPIPVADTIPITSAQITMVIGLSKVFDNKITKGDAEIILKAAAAPLVGRAISKNVLVFVPGVGWAINAAIAGTITEILGWIIANDFATKPNMRQ